ncbi:cation diffusion facilitator family transporter [Methylobacterium sp. E-041]|jgi:cation diffusion facilitator family transporter|uniref:cation diffusion facilitator family transporter n=1 Tax=unclassified Methylobacterium TaxID=2615210 RepID=UPI0011C8D205|nr:MULTISPECIES: cation diffusion facilitator family transporter [unclassified Methylobacterium]MCJ2005738.1 cation diffusion facilitator family transporter [Methylobacterium sp. J-092]MCJ2042723.1 cation diffusion facilitator family transporter [Methylobacterium sp. J-059]MCJ2077291.1 cation diffusion facilitator family transporter [Methylobacterium sp. E-016]MCJ2107556.1 cation diffusion facilitator family transporter [Methylobacterium sp. E-041]MCJ2112855.1 cation diffusion facilitator fami
MSRTQKAALASAVVGLVVTGLKFLAYWLTGSLALYSDALESIINVVAALSAFVALRVAGLPADDDHPYGHHKAEFFSAVIEGALIIVASLLILREAYYGILAPKPVDAPALGLAINAGATVINAVWAWALLRWGKAWRSPALVADGRHVLADVFTSGGVLVGVGLVLATGIPVLDPVVAGLVALNILWSGWKMVRESVDGLMDRAAPGEMVGQIRALISLHGEGALEAHDVRTRYAGQATFIDFHLVVPGEMSVREAHEICDRLEDALETTIPGAVVVIHVEPSEHAKFRGVPVL